MVLHHLKQSYLVYYTLGGRGHMKLLTKEILEAFKKQGSTAHKKPEDIKIIVKYFNPAGAGTWYCYEYDPKDRIFWCFANLGDPMFAECGTLSLDELESITLPLGLSIERDLHFGKHTLKEVMDTIQNGGHV
jgi:hypothetical protein